MVGANDTQTQTIGWRALALLIAFHLAIVGLFYTDIVHDPNHSPGTFHFHHGGDENDFFALALSLHQQAPIETRMTLGYPLLLQPLVALTGVQHFRPLVEPVSLFHALILFPVAQAILANVALRLTGRRTVAVAAVALWTALPLLIYLALALTGRGSLGAIWAVHYIWAQMLSDPPAAFLTLVTFWLALRILNSDRLAWSMALGAVCGFMLLIRVNTVLSIAPVFLALLVARRWREALVAGALAALVFSPQLVYNATFFGSPFTLGYDVLDTEAPYGLLSPQYVLNALQSGYGPLLVVAGLALLALIGVGAWMLAKISLSAAIMLGGTALAYGAFFALYYYSWTGGLSRFLIPASPVFALLTAVLLARIGRWTRVLAPGLIRSAPKA